MNRRDFLRSRRLASAAAQFLDLANDLSQPADTGEALLLRFSRRAMATTFEVVLPFDTPRADEAANAALDEIDRLEAQLTVYRDTSEVTRLNQLAPYTSLVVEEGLFELLETSARLHAESEGAFDVTAGALIKAWGFFRGPRRVPSEEERARALERVGMEHVALDRGGRSVRYRKPGLEINLGSIGKGYALDRAAALLRNEWNLTSALLHGGHSSVYAIGVPPGDRGPCASSGPSRESGSGWSVGLRHPWDTEKSLGAVRLRDRALGTSAATYRHLEHEGRKLGHLLDPRTGWPAEGMASASVLAPTAAEADALATVFYINGVDWARGYCEAHPNVAAILLPAGEDATPVALGQFDA
jgi:thiamine biosynthesis lipoprotein